MKFYTMLCFFILGVSICKAQKNTAEKLTFQKQYTQLKKDKKFRKQLKSLEGNWINSNYLESIKEHKSLYKLQLDGDILVLFFKKKDLLKNNKINGLSLHEGAEFYLKYKEEEALFANDLKEYKDDKNQFNIEIKDKNNLVLNYEKQNTKLPFQKIKKDFTTIFNEILIEGNFFWERGYGKVSFLSNGRVKGFQNFNYYQLVFDFVEDFEVGDIILFSEKKDIRNWDEASVFAIKYLSDGISLREMRLHEKEIRFEYKSDETILLNKQK